MNKVTQGMSLRGITGHMWLKCLSNTWWWRGCTEEMDYKKATAED